MTTLSDRPNTALARDRRPERRRRRGAHDRDAVVANINTLVDKARARGRAGRLGAAQRRRPAAGLRRRGSTSPSCSGTTPSRSCTSATATRSRTPTSRTCWPPPASVGWSSPARRPTRASARPSTARSCAATTSRWSSDAHTTEDLTAWGAPPPDQVIAHTNLYWKFQSAPGRTAGTVADEGRHLHRLTLSPRSTAPLRGRSSAGRGGAPAR